MKMILILLILITLYTFNLFAQWQPDVRLTYNPAASSTSFNNAWCIASSGDFVHAVWYDIRDGNREIYYKRSTDGGVSWGADTRLTNNSANSWYPSVSVSSSVVHVVWQDNRDGNEEIYYKRSTDGGLSWGTDTRLTSNSGYSLSPSGAVSGSEVHVVWYEDRDGNNEIYYKRSSDGGISWGADTRLTNDLADSYGSSVSVSGSVVHVAWQDKRDSNYEIYHKRSTDAGISWGTDTRLTNNPALSRYPSLSASGSIVHIVWEDYRGADFNIYYKRSTDGGTSWTADIPLTLDSGDSYHPSLSVNGSVLHAVWSDNRDGNSNIYYKRSTDAGISWQADTPLTSNSATAVSVSVSVSGQVVHVVWQDNREGNYEIFYKRNPTGNSVSIRNINSELPNEFLLLQNYPNPFNPNTVITYRLATRSFTSLKIYDLSGKEASTLVNEQLQPGTYEVDFDGNNFTSGVYFYSLVTDEFIETKKMILTK